MKKNRVVKILTLVLAIVMVLSLAGCGPKGKVRDVVELFVERANALDYQGMFDIMASDTVKEIRGNKSLSDFLAEKTSEEIAAAIIKQILPMGVSDPVKFLQTLTIDYEGADIREDFSSLYAVVTFESDGQTITKDAVFNMLRKNVSEPWTLRDIAL
ncbi:MAG TPA: hypothetical protein PLT91_07405 [Clostridia bacterium]|nr:MAG: hypothetical protein BWX97_00457 [Firmicutes bacterium ADurb.Bin146]HOD93621.1 hypothetical protein [Clostridia bacterium]HQM40048.1 hypothetical protein [Clostridia bacterium]